jgi:hypothetical protein
MAEATCRWFMPVFFHQVSFVYQSSYVHRLLVGSGMLDGRFSGRPSHPFLPAHLACMCHRYGFTLHSFAQRRRATPCSLGAPGQPCARQRGSQQRVLCSGHLRCSPQESHPVYETPSGRTDPSDHPLFLLASYVTLWYQALKEKRTFCHVSVNERHVQSASPSGLQSSSLQGPAFGPHRQKQAST